jgi:hypothetical protein
VLYGDGGGPAGAFGLDDRVKLPIAVTAGDQGHGRSHAAHGRRGHDHLQHGAADDKLEGGSVTAFSSTGLSFDDSIKPDLVAPGVAVAT